MALMGGRWSCFMPAAAAVFFIFILSFVLVDADDRSKRHGTDDLDSTSRNYLMKAARFLKLYEFSGGAEDLDSSYFMEVARFLKKYEFSGHVWPEMEFGWKIVAGTMIGCFGAAFGSVGGVGGGGIFIPMLMLIIGFDAKSSAALSKCMITGAAVSTVYHNMKLKHPTLDIPIFEYDLLLLILPCLLLGISLGVTFSVIFPDWAITALLIILFFGTSVKAFLKGIDTWKQETILKEAAAKLLHPSEVDYKPLLGGPSNNSEKSAKGKQVNVLENIRWMELGVVVFVWIGYLILQIAKNYTATCSTAFWVLNLLQIPVSASVSLYQAIGLYKGTRRVRSMGEAMTWSIRKLAAFCICGMVAGTIGGLLGIGGGFVMGPLFIEIGIHPLVSSATATLGMTFSASLSVVEYYLLDRFPIPYGKQLLLTACMWLRRRYFVGVVQYFVAKGRYFVVNPFCRAALYFIGVSIVAAFFGQYVITKLITITGRASLIIFVLSFTIFISGISLGGVGISNLIGKIERGEYMGFEDLCNNTG